MSNTSTHEHVVGGGVPAQEAHALGVTLQLDDGVCERQGQSTIWDFPNLSNSRREADTSAGNRGKNAASRVRWGLAYHDAAVLRAAGDDVVIMGAEFDVEDRPRVAAHGGVGHVDTPRLQTQIPP